MFWWVIWWHDGQSKRPLRQDKHGHYFLISHLLFVLQYFYHNFESCCWTIYTNREIILHDVFVQLQSIFNCTNINHGQSYPIFGFWLKYTILYYSARKRDRVKPRPGGGSEAPRLHRTVGSPLFDGRSTTEETFSKKLKTCQRCHTWLCKLWKSCIEKTRAVLLSWS